MTLHRFSALFSSAMNIIGNRPVLAIFDITKHCNQNCPMCNIPKNACEEMSVDEIEALAARLRRFGIGYVFIQGGEPLVRKDVTDIVDIFIGKGIKPTVITNGVLLNRELASALAVRPCNVAISLDSLERERYAFLRGSDDLEKVLANIREAALIENKKGNWSLTATISRLSDFEDIKRISNLAEELGWMFAIRPYISVSGIAGRYCEELSYEEKDVAEIFRFFYEKAKKENYLASLIYRRHIEYIEGRPMPPCDAMKRSFLVRENGIIAPCIEMPGKEIDIDDFARCKREYRDSICRCNAEHPCFYNDAREIGMLLRGIPGIILHLPVVFGQMRRYGNFF